MNSHSDALRQNLIDAGCHEDTIEHFIKCKSKEDRLRILAEQRKRLLEAYHNDAKRLDCLDYLLNQLQKEDAS